MGAIGMCDNLRCFVFDSSVWSLRTTHRYEGLFHNIACVVLSSFNQCPFLVKEVIMQYAFCHCTTRVSLVWLTTLVLFLTGCSSTEQVYVVHRDVPENPTVVVIPATNQLFQIHFANDIEEKEPGPVEETTSKGSLFGRAAHLDGQ
jgi:hypothetical protein